MTLVGSPPPPVPGAGPDLASPGAPASGERGGAGPGALWREAAATGMWILAFFLLGFVVWFAFASRLYYDRVQAGEYANFRVSLALATAPVGPTNPANPKQLVTLGTPVAVLNIPQIGLNAVVGEGTTGQVLEGGPGHLRYTPLPGQPGASVIFGRRTGYGGPFSRLSSLHAGDVLTVTTGQGVARYKVIDLRRGGDKIPPLTAQGRLILITADGPPLAPTGVLQVDADLISQPNPAPPMVISASQLGASEQVLGTDQVALVPLVLWGAALLVAITTLAWASQRWGRWQAWIVAVPVLAFLSLAIADQVTLLLPNLM